MNTDAARSFVSSVRHAGRSAGGRRTSSRDDTPARDVSLDVLRGFAVALMVLDHVALLLGGFEAALLRDTVTRAAMPLFFVIAGHLAGRVSSRHAYVLVAGFLLPVLVPWIDSPNVLVLYVLGVVVLQLAATVALPRWVIVAAALTVAANGAAVSNGFYDPAALFGLMALGRLMPRSAFRLRWLTLARSRGESGPLLAVAGVLERVGRAPLRWYVGHLLVLELLRVSVQGVS